MRPRIRPLLAAWIAAALVAGPAPVVARPAVDPKDDGIEAMADPMMGEPLGEGAPLEVQELHDEADPSDLFRKRDPEPLPGGFFVEEGMALTPEQSEAVRLNNEGVALMRRGKVEEAAERLRASLTRVPGYVNGLRNLAVAYKLKKDYHRSKALFRKVIHLDPDDAQAHLGLALVLWHLGEKQESLREQRLAGELDPTLAPQLEAFREGRFER